MRHRLGNGPKCKECYWYREKEEHDGCREDGWCHNKHQLSVGINGRKREHPPDREPVMWNGCCRDWEDAEDRLTRFEVLTGHPEEWRTPIEKELILQKLGKSKEGETDG